MHYHLIYISRTDHNWTKQELFALLRSAWSHNKSMGISGMLVFLDGKFIQLLEGDKTVVLSTYNKIIQDKRHYNITRVLEGASAEPIFKDWSMGFKNIDIAEFEDLTGYRDPAAFFTDDAINNHSHPALIFLKLFYDKNYRDFVNQLR